MKGEFTQLRLWQKEFAPIVYDWYWSGQYPAFFRNIPTLASESQFVDFPGLTGQTVFGILTKEKNKKGQLTLQGLMTIYNFEPVNKCCSVGIMVEKGHEGKRIASDALLTLLKYLFLEKCIRRVSFEYIDLEGRISRIGVLASNLTGSKAEKIEDTPYFEGRKKKVFLNQGKYHDMILTCLFKDQFEKLIEAWYG